jgi:glycosyltransferase involved in cell wall biosynthesis
MKFSILMPTFNRHKFIRKSVDAILNQTHEDFELIIKDGGESIYDLLPKDDRIIYIHSKDRGITHAMNTAYYLAHSDMCCWANDDDVLNIDTLEYVNKELDDYQPHEWGYGKIILSSDGSLWGEPWDYNKLKQYNYVPQPTVFWRTEMLHAVGVFSEADDLVSDYEYWLRMGAQYEPKFMNKILAFYNVHPEQITAYNNPEQARQAEMVKKQYKYVEANYV